MPVRFLHPWGSVYHFDADYCEVATLRDGQMVHLRLVRPTDKGMLLEAFGSTSPDTRYKRFFAPKSRLSERELQYLTEMDQVSHFAIGAERIAGDGHLQGLGIARFIRYKGLDATAEAAVTVIDEMQGKGLGSLLLQRLVAAARERGIRRLRCEVLRSNQAMQELLRGLTSGVVTARQSGAVSTIELALPEVSPVNPPDQPPRHDALFKLFTMVATGAVVMGEHPLLVRRTAPDEA